MGTETAALGPGLPVLLPQQTAATGLAELPLVGRVVSSRDLDFILL